MSTSAGPDISLDGLVFGYDTGYGVADNSNATRFNQGKPTTNLISAHNDNHVRAVTWTNSGTWEYDHNASNNTKPTLSNVDMSKVNLMHGKTLTLGSQHFGCANQSVSASTTYTMSVYYFQNRAGASRPYFRQSTNNNNLGYLKYNGSTNTSNWPVGKWIRISVTVTTASNENACYMSNYLGGAVGDQVWYCAPMVEQASHLSPFADGTRSSTQSLIDLKETTDIDVDDVSFDSNAQLSFDGTDDKIVIPADSYSNIGTDNFTVEVVFKNTKTSNYNHFFSVKDQYHFALKMQNTSNRNIYVYRSSALSTHEAITANAPSTTDYYHLVCKREGDNLELYLNGVSKGTKSGWGSIEINNDEFATSIGTHGTTSEFTGGEIPIVKLYNKSLTSAEIKSNFNAIKNRFGI